MGAGIGADNAVGWGWSCGTGGGRETGCEDLNYCATGLIACLLSRLLFDHVLDRLLCRRIVDRFCATLSQLVALRYRLIDHFGQSSLGLATFCLGRGRVFMRTGVLLPPSVFHTVAFPSEKARGVGGGEWGGGDRKRFLDSDGLLQ